jgi:hypothetical protein
LLFLFVDGVGLAPASSDNPFATENAPEIKGLLGGALTSESAGCRDGTFLGALDACLGITGLPQSATGQATLFSGVNAAATMGRHVSGFPGPQVREIVERHGVLLKAAKAGLRATFANAYSRDYIDRLDAGNARPSVTTCMTRAAGLGLRNTRDLAAGEAVTWDIVGDLYGALSGQEVSEVDPFVAGRRLAALSAEHDLTVYETFLPDLAGHGRAAVAEADVIERLDGLLGGIRSAGVGGLTVVLTSDHGNFEDRSSRGHTRNPVPLLAFGLEANRFRDLQSLTEVAPRILDVLSISG